MGKKRKNVEIYEQIIKLGQLMSSATDFSNIVKKASGKIKEILSCDHVLIHLFDQKNNELKCVYTYKGEDDKDIRFEVTLPMDENHFVTYCAEHSALLHIRDAKQDIRYAKLPEEIRKLRPKNTLLSPLVNQGNLFGVIEAIHTKKDFDDDDEFFIEVIASQLTNIALSSELISKLEEQFIQTVSALADAIGKKDTYTGGHTRRVAHFAEMIGEEMELGFNEMKDLKMAAVLHDIGKIGIEDKILKKTAPLTKEEFEVMMNHPQLGYEILQNVEGLKNAIDGMRYHHERPDGKGYPYQLPGDEIPTIAHIISVADTFDAMISTRPYRKGLPPMEAYFEIQNNAGTQFDSKVVEAFVEYFKKSKMYKPEQDKIKKAS